MKKKLNAYRTPKGQFRKVKGELLIEFLRMWESHTGPATELARNLGMTRPQLSTLVREARKLVKTSDAIDPAFQALQIQGPSEVPPSKGIELTLDAGVIRFPTVDTLMDFLKKAS